MQSATPEPYQNSMRHSRGSSAYPDADIPPSAGRTQTGFDTVGNSRRAKNELDNPEKPDKVRALYEEQCAGDGPGGDFVCARFVGERAIGSIFFYDAPAHRPAKSGKPSQFPVERGPVPGQ